jgi:hypothetical protein
MIALAFSLTACDSGGKKIVDTKDGAIITTMTGDLYKVIGTEMYKITERAGDITSGTLKTFTQEISSKNAKLKFEIKAKVFNERTDYIITASVVPKSIKNKALSVSDIIDIKNGTIDGIASIDVVYEDKDGFSLGSDTFSIKDQWILNVDHNDVAYQAEYKGSLSSAELRNQKDSRIVVQWRSRL